MDPVKREDDKKPLKMKGSRLNWEIEALEKKEHEQNTSDRKNNDMKAYGQPTAKLKRDKERREFKPISGTNSTTAMVDLMEIQLITEDTLESDSERSMAIDKKQDVKRLASAQKQERDSRPIMGNGTGLGMMAMVDEYEISLLNEESDTSCLDRITDLTNNVAVNNLSGSQDSEDMAMPMDIDMHEQLCNDVQSNVGPSNVEESMPDSPSVSTETHSTDIQILRQTSPGRLGQRFFMDYVQVPTVNWLKKISRPAKEILKSEQLMVKREKLTVKNEPTDVWRIPIKPEPLTEDDVAQLERLRVMKQPDVKVKKEALLSDEGVNYRLRAMLGDRAWDVCPINLDDECRLATVTRAWMTDHYGGSRQSGRPSINTKKFTHGIDDIYYMTYEFNPNAPKIPGANGLAFGCWGETQVIKRQRVIMRTRAPRWTYMGSYRSVPSNPLTEEEWCAQSLSFQNHWAKEISKTSWGAEVRTRIGLRNDMDREPTPDEIDQGMVNGIYKNMSTDVIKQAFACGLEKIGVWCMECIGYDEDFQRHLATMPADYVSPMDKPKDPTKSKKASKQTKLAAPAPKEEGSGKLKRQDSISSEVKAGIVDEEEKVYKEDEDSDEDSDEDGRNEPSLAGRPKRTIKVPRRPDEFLDISEPTLKRRRIA